MGTETAISWCDSTFNPWRGCTKVSAGCANCYADTLSKRNPKVLGVWGPNGTRVVASEATWGEPLKWDKTAKAAGERHRVFCASLADVFEDWRGPMVASDGNSLWRCYGSLSNSPIPSTGLPEGCHLATMADIRERLFDLIGQTPNLDWLLLTKRPERWRKCWPLEPIPGHVSQNRGDGQRWVSFPNVWLGTSVENQAAADERIPHLLAAPARVRFLSCEPLLGPVNLDTWFEHFEADASVKPLSGYVSNDGCYEPWTDPNSRIHWVIAGGESGPSARPMHPGWARSLRDQCQAAGVAFHFKQWGEWVWDINDPWAKGSDAKAVRIFTDPACALKKVGKAAAGRLLDGRTWDEFPITSGAK